MMPVLIPPSNSPMGWLKIVFCRIVQCNQPPPTYPTHHSAQRMAFWRPSFWHPPKWPPWQDQEQKGSSLVDVKM